MLFNVKKCKVVHFGKEPPLQVQHEWEKLERVNERDLAAIFTEDLKVAGQCIQAYRMVSKALGMIS